MPHKRAKRSVRERERSEKGHDMAPGKNSLRNEAIPKSAARVLNALKIREDFKAKKRQLGDTNDGRDGKRQKVDDRKKKEEKDKFPGILPGESLQHYNKRVEDSMRPLVRNAMKASLATIRGAKKQELEEKAAKKLLAQEKRQNEDDESSADPPPSLSSSKHAGKPKEFQVLPSSAPKRLNDIVQAPPEMIRLKNARRSSAAMSIGGKRDGVISMAQKQMMEAEREKAIARYRQLKAAKRKDGDIGGDN
ncbi:hypothetical protein WG66_005614 [Moniliophthora roreri]|uniref:Uncharacterized protein n=1 Tax=Moniliophthora roreri TaxID=221103 RepID=A0A0W0F6Y2_MONRR|nr:hypothetical protein WG66_005614 [Moniliophthora roreri]